jgi:hypothetical protein
MSYRDRTRKKVTLPSGATVFIRRFNARDFFEAGGDPAKPDDQAVNVKLASRALSSCTWGFEFKGERFKITDKRTEDCAADELSIDDLEQADADSIMSAVLEFSAPKKEELLPT